MWMARFLSFSFFLLLHFETSILCVSCSIRDTPVICTTFELHYEYFTTCNFLFSVIQVTRLSTKHTQFDSHTWLFHDDPLDHLYLTLRMTRTDKKDPGVRGQGSGFLYYSDCFCNHSCRPLLVTKQTAGFMLWLPFSCRPTRAHVNHRSPLRAVVFFRILPLWAFWCLTRPPALREPVWRHRSSSVISQLL